MRSLLAILAAAALVAACAPRPEPTCETRPDGARLFVDHDTAAYGDLVRALRNDPNHMVALAPPGDVRVVGAGSGPGICKTDRKFAKVVTITYPARDDRHIGASLDLYFGQDDRVAVAEFYTMLLAP
jgi:hypothetical protein